MNVIALENSLIKEKHIVLVDNVYVVVVVFLFFLSISVTVVCNFSKKQI